MRDSLIGARILRFLQGHKHAAEEAEAPVVEPDEALAVEEDEAPAVEEEEAPAAEGVRSERWASGMRPDTEQTEKSAEWEKGLRLDRCEVADELGKGNFGAAYLLREKDSKAPKAVIKVFHRDDGKTDEENAQALAKFERDIEEEVAFYRKVGEHPNIAKCAGVWTVDGHKGLVLEYVAGANVKATAKKLRDDYKGGKLSQEHYWGAAQYAIAQTLRGLEQLEKAGVVHNDIKPDNIMIDAATGEIKLIDFGLATEAGEQTAEGRKGGTLPRKLPIGAGTTAPEYKNSPGSTEAGDVGAVVDAAADRFGLGGVAYLFGEGTTPLYGAAPGTDPEQAMEDFVAAPAPGSQPPRLLTKEPAPAGPPNNDTLRELEDEIKLEAAASGITLNEEQLHEQLRKRVLSRAAYKDTSKGAGKTFERVDPDTGIKQTISTGERKKNAGKYAAATAYSQFVNRLMDPNPNQRPTVGQALAHPFLSKPILDEESARQVLRGQVPIPAGAAAGTDEHVNKVKQVVSLAERITKLSDGILGNYEAAFNELIRLQKQPAAGEEGKENEANPLARLGSSLTDYDHQFAIWKDQAQKVVNHLTKLQEASANLEYQTPLVAALRAIDDARMRLTRFSKQLRARLLLVKGVPVDADELAAQRPEKVAAMEKDAEQLVEKDVKALAEKVAPLLKELRELLEQQEGPEVTEEREQILLRLRDPDSAPPKREELKKMLSVLPQLHEEARIRKERARQAEEARQKQEREEMEKRAEQRRGNEAVQTFFNQVAAAFKANEEKPWANLEEFGKAKVPETNTTFKRLIMFSGFSDLAVAVAAYKERTGIDIIASDQGGEKT